MTISKADAHKSKIHHQAEKIQTAEGWKRKQEQILKNKHADELKDRRRAI